MALLRRYFMLESSRQARYASVEPAENMQSSLTRATIRPSNEKGR